MEALAPATSYFFAVERRQHGIVHQGSQPWVSSESVRYEAAVGSACEGRV